MRLSDLFARGDFGGGRLHRPPEQVMNEASVRWQSFGINPGGDPVEPHERARWILGVRGWSGPMGGQSAWAEQRLWLAGRG